MNRTANLVRAGFRQFCDRSESQRPVVSNNEFDVTHEIDGFTFRKIDVVVILHPDLFHPEWVARNAHDLHLVVIVAGIYRDIVL